MAKQTINFNLSQPEIDDGIQTTITSLSDNFEIIDEQLETNDTQLVDVNERFDFAEQRLDKLRPTPTKLEFSRDTEVTYKGVNYEPQQPIYTGNGVRISASDGESLKTSSDVVLSTNEGQVELSFIPNTSSFTALYADVTDGVFELTTADTNRLRFTFGNGHYVETSTNVYSVGSLVNVVLRWSMKTRLYEIWVNGKYEGQQNVGGGWTGVVPEQFTSSVSIGTIGSITLTGIQFSTVAREVR
jgi:hypothetical protein